MAISGTQVWNVQPGTGSDNNGGGFDPGVTSPGTDYSQASSPHVVFDGVTIAAHAAGATATIIVTGYTVATTDVGNTVQITGGSAFLTGFYTITAASVGSVTWTLDRTCTSGAASGMTGNMGGTLNTVSKAFGVAVAANIIYFKGTYTASATLSFNLSSAPRPFCFVGYGTTPGDGVQATWTTSTNSIDMVSMGGNAQNLLFQNIIFTTTAGTVGSCIRAVSGNATFVACTNCSFSGFTYALNGNFNVDYAILGLFLDSCEIKNCTQDGVINYAYTRILGCYIHGNTGNGVNMNGIEDYPGLTVAYSTIKSNGASGINISASVSTLLVIDTVLLNCNLINNTADGLTVSNAHAGNCPAVMMWNCAVDSNGGYGVNFSGGGKSWSLGVTGPNMRNNAYGSSSLANTSGNFSSGLSGDASDVSYSVDPFTSRSTGNFALNSTSGGGPVLKGAGYDFGNTGF